MSDSRDPRGFKQISGAINQVVKPYVDKKSALIIRIYSEWQNIVGKVIAAKTRPVKVIASKENSETKYALLLEVDSGFALELKYLESEIIEKINLYYGSAIINRIKVNQVMFENQVRPQAISNKPIENNLKQMIDEIGDNELNSALKSLITTINNK